MNGLKIGTETYFDIKDVEISNCCLMLSDIYPGMTTVIALESCDGARIRDITIKDIDMDKVVCPLMIFLNKRNKYGFQNDIDKSDRQKGGLISEVLIENINSKDAEIPSIITGFKNDNTISPTNYVSDICEKKYAEGRVENICIRNFIVAYKDNVESICLQDTVAENIDDYPESNAFGDLHVGS